MSQSAGSEEPCGIAICPPGQRHRELVLQEEPAKPAAADARAKAKQRSELAASHLDSAAKEAINRNNHSRAAARVGAELVLSSPV